MEHQVRRGIYRQKAQRLSIALAPVAAHRSLLFNKVRADLASKANYSELSPRSNDSDSEYDAESPPLFMLTPRPQKMSAIISAKSAASIYSQDSWSNRSPFVANDNRRHAIAVSPSLQLEDLLKDGTVARGRPLPTVPLRSAPLSALARTSFQGASKVPSPQRGLFEALTPTLQTAMMQMPVPEIHLSTVQEQPEQLPAPLPSSRKPLPEIKASQNESKVVLDTVATNSEDAPSVANAETPGRKPLPEVTVIETETVTPLDLGSETKRASKHTKALGKVLRRISMQATKKEIAQRIRTESITHPMPPMPTLLPSLHTKKSSIDDLKLTLPDVPKVEPIRTSFIAKVAAKPMTFSGTHASISEDGGFMVHKKRLSPTEVRDKERRRRTTMPPTPTSVKRSLSSPMLAVPPMALRAPPPRRPITPTGQQQQQHRRTQSSPTVMQTSHVLPLMPQRRGRNRRWDLENMPPLPPLPPLPDLALPGKLARPTLPLVPARKRSDSVAPHPF